MNKQITKDWQIKVQKRGGQLVPFKAIRIHIAIANAFKEVHGTPRETDLSEEDLCDVENVTLCVLKAIQGRAGSSNELTVEDIQDEVIRQLYENSFKDAAQSYANYRREHAGKRSLFELYKAIKRDGKIVSFKPEKITVAIAKAFRASSNGDLTDEILDTARELSDKVVAQVRSRWPKGNAVPIEEIQDLVEKVLMDCGHYEVAKCYIVYREERKRDRMARPTVEASLDWVKRFKVKTASGELRELDLEDILFKVQTCCKNLENVSADLILKESIKNYYNEITEKQISLSNILAARSLIEKEPNYSFVSTRLLLLLAYEEALGIPVSFETAKAEYPRYLAQYIRKAVEHELLNPDLLQFDLDLLGRSIKVERDLEFHYMGLQTLYDRYFIHWEERRLEIPQVFWMRVAMGLAKNEGKEKNQRAIEFYNILSTFRFVSSTPTLFNSGTIHSQLSSCYLSTIKDDLHHIFKCMQDDAMLSKWSGGLSGRG